MNSEAREREAQRQALAEQLERAGAGPSGDPGVEHYRLVQRAVRLAAMPALPADFAAQVARCLRDFEEQAGVEVWLVRAAIALGIVGAIVLAQPALASLLASLDASKFPALPWRLLGAAALGMVAAALVDTAASRKGTS